MTHYGSGKMSICDCHSNMTQFIPVNHSNSNCVIPIGIFNSPKYDVNEQYNTEGIGPLNGRTSCNRRSVMHVLAVF